MTGRTCFNCGSEIGAEMQVVDLFDEIVYACGDCRETRADNNRQSD